MTAFTLGQTVATPDALAALVTSGQSPTDFLARHAAGDFGEVGDEDSRYNRQDIAAGNGRALSAYTLANQERIWIITNLVDGRRNDACLLLPNEY
jgi:hypothetical protein